jgi:hypothetical protein
MICVRSIMSMALLRGRGETPFGFLEKIKMKEREKNTQILILKMKAISKCCTICISIYGPTILG